MMHAQIPHGEGMAFDAFDAIGMPAFVAGRDARQIFRVVRMNAAMRRIVPGAHQSTQEALARILTPRVAAELRRIGRIVLTEDRPITRDEALRIDGRNVWWRFTLSPYDLAEDLVLVAAQDVTDLKDGLLRLTAVVAEQKDAIDTTRTLAGIAVHDTRAPLANLMSLVDVLLDGFEEDAAGRRDMIATCGRVAETALHAVDDLMDRIAACNLAPAVHEPLDLGGMCGDIAALVDPGARLDIVYPDIRIATDAVLLQVSLRNLIDNAVRHAASLVEVTVDMLEDGQTIALTVADDGPGFGKGAPAHPGVPRPAGRGFGLGAIARLLGTGGGTISPMPPRLGRGATMQITLPGRVIDGPATLLPAPPMHLSGAAAGG